MIYATYINGYIIGKHKGDSPFIDPNNVTEIQAGYDELDMVYQQIPGIRSCSNRIVTWYGDDAKFIVANLKL